MIVTKEKILQFSDKLDKALSILANDGILGLGLEYKTGQRGNSELFWWRMRINTNVLPEAYKVYTHVHLMPYKVDASYFAEKICSDGSCSVDYSSGNIHPLELKEKMDLNIKQLVLVSKNGKPPYGPRYINDIGSMNCYEISKVNNKGKILNKKIYIPKVCYFSKDDSIEYVGDEKIVNNLLSMIWEILVESGLA